MAGIRLPAMGLPIGRRVSVAKPQNINIAQTTGKSALPNLGNPISSLAGVGVPMKVKKINVRNTGFKID